MNFERPDNSLIPAIETRICMVPVDPDVFRYAQPKDRLAVKLTTSARQYVVVNSGFNHVTRNIITFKVSSTGIKLASCTCQDFSAIKYHGRQCKHIALAYDMHVVRMASIAKLRERADAATLKYMPEPVMARTEPIRTLAGHLAQGGTAVTFFTQDGVACI